MQAYGQASSTAVEEGKMFVGGLSWQTTKESLAEYFSKWGQIADSQIMINQKGEPRGFGFITYVNPASVEEALRVKKHVVDNKTVDPKRATVKGQQVPQGGDKVQRKVFVGGLHSTTTEADVEAYFKDFIHKKQLSGDVVTVELKKDPETERMRGFGFVEFDDEKLVAEAVTVHYHNIGGKSVEVKRAESKSAINRGGRSQQQHQQQPYGQQAYAQQQGMYQNAGNYRGQQQQQQQQQYYGSDQYYGNYSYQQQYPQGYGQYASQQAPAGAPQQMGSQGYGQDASVAAARSGGYGAASTGYQQFGGQGPASGYDQSQGNHVAGMAAYQQQSYNPNSQAAASYNQQSYAGRSQQY